MREFEKEMRTLLECEIHNSYLSKVIRFVNKFILRNSSKFNIDVIFWSISYIEMYRCPGKLPGEV